MAKVALDHRNDGVVGFDIAGKEAGYPPTRHLDAFQLVMRENFHITIHAGEAFGLPSIHEALHYCGAERLGHGVRILDDIELTRTEDRGPEHAPGITEDTQVRLGQIAAYVRDTRVPLEMCPSSNVHTGAAPSIAAHPIGLLTDLRFRVTVNTDNRLMSNTSMTKEFGLLVDELGFDLGGLEWLTVNADEVGVLVLRSTAVAHQRDDQAPLRRAAPKPAHRSVGSRDPSGSAGLIPPHIAPVAQPV